MHEVVPGMVSEVTEDVIPARTTGHVGSLPVYSTPSMVSFIERTCMNLIQPSLTEGHTSVGTRVDAKHLAPTPLGKTVSVRVEVVAVDGNLVTFRAIVRDDQEIVGECEHQRTIIDTQRFLRRLQKKVAAG